MKSTEILDRSQAGPYKWTINRDYKFSPTGDIFGYSMVNIPQTDSNEEYLLLIGGCFSLVEMKTNPNVYTNKVHKYNGSWSFFGNLQKVRTPDSGVKTLPSPRDIKQTLQAELSLDPLKDQSISKFHFYRWTCSYHWWWCQLD